MTDVLVIFGILVWLAVLSFQWLKIGLHYQKLVGKTKKENLSDILDKLLEEIERSKKEAIELRKEVEKLEKNNRYHVQKVGILRFNPFEDTGGDQSFVLAILDGTDTGIVLTSLHGRGLTRWYAKNVKEGKGVDHELSEEEIKAIKEAKVLRKED